MKKYYEIERLQSYIIFLIRDNLEKIEKQVKHLREYVESHEIHKINLTLVASINVEDMQRIPQADVFTALVNIKENPRSATEQYQKLSKAIMLEIKSLEMMQRDYDYYRTTRLGYERNYHRSISDLNYFLDGLKQRDSRISDPDPFIEETKLIWNKFTKSKKTQISAMEHYHFKLVKPLYDLIEARYEILYYQELMKLLRECKHWYKNLTNLISVIKVQLSSHADSLVKGMEESKESAAIISSLNNRIPSFVNLVRV